MRIEINPVIMIDEPTNPFFLKRTDCPQRSFNIFFTDITGARVQIVLAELLSLTAQKGTNLDFNGLSRMP